MADGEEERAEDLPRPVSKEEFDAFLHDNFFDADEGLEERKELAHLSGKEPFDLDRFFSVYVMETAPPESRRETAIRSWERWYYGPSGEPFKTVVSFAEHMNEVDVYNGGDMHLD
ncbi:MAG: hypothetical protein AAGA65_00645 [Actinomycetota bacterium]